MQIIGLLVAGFLFAASTVAGAQGCPVDDVTGEKIMNKGQGIEATIADAKMASTSDRRIERAVFGLG